MICVKADSYSLPLLFLYLFIFYQGEMQIASRLICEPIWRNNKHLMEKQLNLNLLRHGAGELQ